MTDNSLIRKQKYKSMFMEWKSISHPTFNRIKMISLPFCRDCVIATGILKDTIQAHRPRAHILSHLIRAVTLWSWADHSHAAERRQLGTLVTCPVSHTSKWSRWKKVSSSGLRPALRNPAAFAVTSRERSRGPGMECHLSLCSLAVAWKRSFSPLPFPVSLPLPRSFLLPFTLLNKCFLGTHSVRHCSHKYAKHQGKLTTWLPRGVCCVCPFPSRTRGAAQAAAGCVRGPHCWACQCAGSCGWRWAGGRWGTLSSGELHPGSGAPKPPRPSCWVLQLKPVFSVCLILIFLFFWYLPFCKTSHIWGLFLLFQEPGPLTHSDSRIFFVANELVSFNWTSFSLSYPAPTTHLLLESPTWV